MYQRQKAWIYPNLESKLYEAHISISELAGMLGISRTSVYPKLIGDVGWNIKQQQMIRNKINKRLKRNFTIDYLFKEDSTNGNK